MVWKKLAIFLATVLFLLYKYFTRKFDYWEKKGVPYIKPIPFFGNMINILSPKNPVGKNILEMCNSVGNKDFFGIFVFDRPTLIVKSPKLIKNILVRDFSHFHNRSIIGVRNHPVLSNMLFIQENTIWREARTKLNASFSTSKLKLMFSLMLEESQKLTDHISKIVNIPDVETKEICSKYSINVITRCTFAIDAKCFTDKDPLFRKLGKQMFDFRISTAFRQLAFFFAPNLASFFKIFFFETRIVDIIQNVFSEVLSSRIASEKLKGCDLVDIMLEANRKRGDNVYFSNEAMLGQAIQFFTVGFETVSVALSYSLYELCINPEIQDKLRDEIRTYVKKDDDITFEAVNKMKYLDNCLSETLRKYSGLPFLDRVCSADYKIDDTNVVIEKGTVVYIPLDALHYDPKYFPEPEKYNPDRFSDNSIHDYFLPFGDGPRVCMGQRFGLTEIKLALVSILFKFRLEKSEKTPIPMKYSKKSLILQSEVGIPLKFIPI